VASVILFPGGSGVVTAARNNFLLRVAGAFSAQGIDVGILMHRQTRRAVWERSFARINSH
jgi:hypothetical protein